MIGFARRTFWESIKYTLWPAYRRRREAEMREALKWLIQNPDAPCMIEGRVIPNGYGQPGSDPYLADILGRPFRGY